MAMLAEPRRKTKFVLTPKSKPLWTLESNGIQFGKKLMEKMGWNAGEGLGASGQGIQEPLRQAFKQDTKGMGYSGDGNPFENLDQFNALLASLAGEEPVATESPSFESLEEKSKRSKSRVHYKKFTRGKDLANYSKMDLTCIVGSGKKPKEEEEVEEEVIDGTGETENSHGVTTINSGSIADYFKLKMGQKKLGGFISEENSFELGDVEEGLSKEERKLQRKKRKGFHDEIVEKDAEVSVEGPEEEDSRKEQKKLKKKKRKNSIEEINENDTAICIVEEAKEEKQYEVEEECRKEEKKSRKKKRKLSIEEINENDTEKSAADQAKNCVEEDAKEDIGKERKLKKKKQKRNLEEMEENDDSGICVLEEVKTKKKKKKSCRSETADDTLVNVGTEVHKKKHKKKDKEKEELITINDDNEFVINKKKKRKAKDAEKEDVPGDCVFVEEIHEKKPEESNEEGEKLGEENCEKVKKHKKKKKENSQETAEEDANEAPKKKKKKDKKGEKTEAEADTSVAVTVEKGEKVTENIETNFSGSNLDNLPGYGKTRRQLKNSSQ